MSLPDDTHLDERIRASACDTVPPLVEARLRALLSDFRSRQDAGRPAAAALGRRLAPTSWWRLGVAAAAVVALMAAAAVFLRPRTSFAEVARAVLDRPWVHIRVTRSGQVEREFWFSPTRNVWASRGPDSTSYEDYRLRVSETYDPDAGEVARIPIVWEPKGRGFEAMVVALTALLQEEHPPEKPPAHLDFLGPEPARMTVLKQRVERVAEGGRAWLEYHLTVADPATRQPWQLLFRVDVATKLPVLCRVSGQVDGQPATRETQFDYPDAGPADVYDLGVPKLARRVDRVPAGDLKRILETIRAGRERMDNYRAVFVMRLDLPDYAWWWNDLPVVFYRKGTRFRADYPFGARGRLAGQKRPDPGVTLGEWLGERTKYLRYCTHYVVRDSTTFTCDVRAGNDPDGTPYAEILSVHRMESRNEPGESFPPEWSMRPEFVCRPPLGLGDPQMEPVLDLHPTDGPPGCVLLRVRHTTTKGRVNEKGIGIPDRYRYWLDPGRDYIAMRWDMVMQDAADQETILESDTVEETARSPQGVWYATRIRRSFPSRRRKDQFHDQVCHLNVDFKAELPDTLFEPPSPGKVR